MTEMIKDVVVLVPGITGSTLSRRHGDRVVPVWEPSLGGLSAALRTFGSNLTSLRLVDYPGHGDPGDGIMATGLMPRVHGIPGIWSGSQGYSRIDSWLTRTFHLMPYGGGSGPRDGGRAANFVRFAYDWRLSNTWNAQLLKETVEPVLARWRAQDKVFDDAKLVFVCHSMGGLLARWYAEHLDDAHHTRRIITIGTPHRGSVKALEHLVNGLQRFGKFGHRMTETIRTFPSMYELLPAYDCVERDGVLVAPHDISLPGLAPARIRNARTEFHDRLSGDPTPDSVGYTLYPIVGTRQPTAASATLTTGRIRSSNSIGGDDLLGDGTVSRLAASPRGLPLDSPQIVGMSEQHGALQHHSGTLEQLYTALTGSTRIYMDDTSAAQLGIDMEPAYILGERIAVRVTSSTDKVRLRASALDESGHEVASELLQRERTCVFSASFDGLPAGGYAVVVKRDGSTANAADPVTGSTVVWDPGDAPSPDAGGHG